MRRTTFTRAGIGFAAMALITGSILAPVPAFAAAPGSVVLSSNFESGVAPWQGRGTASVATTHDGRDGTQGMLVTGRTAGWNGAETDLSSLIEAGSPYTVTAWVRLPAGAATTDAVLTVAETPEAYTQVSTPVAVNAGAWTELTGTYTRPAAATATELYIEATDATGDLLVDDVTVTGPPVTGPGGGGAGLGLNADFESGLGAWGVRGDGAATATLTQTDAHSGKGSALVTGRTQPWNGLQTDVSGILTAGTTYDVSAWVKMSPGAGTSDVRLSLERTSAGVTAYDTIATATGVSASGWTQVKAEFATPAAGTAILYFETVIGTASFLVDDIALSDASAVPVQTDIPSIKDEVPWPMGVAVDQRETSGPGETLVAKHYNQITPENDGKPSQVHPTENTYTFDAVDKLVDFAKAHDMRFYFHTLVWYQQTPDWFFQHTDGTPLTKTAADQDLLRARLKSDIDTIADHFRTKYGEFGTPGNPIVAVDVVNEAIDETQTDGLRHSQWFNILGESYLDSAYQDASAAFNKGAVDGPVKLMLNDFNTEQPAKRAAMLKIVQGMLARGLPLNGIGHQFHVQLGQDVAEMNQAIETFAPLGLTQAVTEFDVAIPGVVTQAKLIDQGYFYRDVFAMLRTHPDLFSVTVWGPYDSRSWLTSSPLPFDGNLQAKPAYYGIVDPSKLPPRIFSASAPQADIALGAGATVAPEWQLLSLTPIGDKSTAAFAARWSGDHLTTYATVKDATNDGAADSVTFFVGTKAVVVTRSGVAGSVVQEIPGGYRVVTQIPVAGLAVGATTPFDVRVADGSAGTVTSWNDKTNKQESGGALGVLTLKRALVSVDVPAGPAPKIDGVIDPEWATAATITTGVQVSGTGGATAKVRVLWSPGAVNLLYQVTDPTLDASSSNAYEQDSVEAFVSPDNNKGETFGPDDGQYRVSFQNRQSIAGDLTKIGDRLTSAATVVPGGYLVEMRIALGKEVTPATLIGLEVQVNDATAGVRTAVHSWADPTGNSYLDTSNWGVARLLAPPTPPITNVALPTIRGSATVGRMLEATPGTWSVKNPAVAYQWKRDGVVVAGATSARYVLVAADAGRKMTVTATVSVTGADPASATSKPVTVARLRSTTTGSVSPVLSFGGRGIGYTARVHVSGMSATGRVTVYADGRPIANAMLTAGADRVSVALPRLSPGVHVLTSRYSGTTAIADSVSFLSLVFVF